MKLSISNIGWTEANDLQVYALMQKYGFSGLEIAPTRILPQNPYDRLPEIRRWSEKLQEDYGFSVPSMQSIWYGRSESIFGSQEERQALLEYTKKAVDFAQAIGCGNLVFGCPRNRNLPEGADPETAVSFFRELGDYAKTHNTVIGMEANPPIYNTNYINDTASALALIRAVDSRGFRLNLDVGTMVHNEESLDEIAGHVDLINHVHISEPYLAPVQERTLHADLLALLKGAGYRGYVSIEMGRQEDLSLLENVMAYLAAIQA